MFAFDGLIQRCGNQEKSIWYTSHMLCWSILAKVTPNHTFPAMPSEFTGSLLCTYGMPRPVMPMFNVVTNSVFVLGYNSVYGMPDGLRRARELPSVLH